MVTFSKFKTLPNSTSLDRKPQQLFWFLISRFRPKEQFNTSLVVLPHISNVLGNILDIKYLNEECKKINRNVKILVDGVAFLPHKLIDVNNLGIDYY